MKVLILENDFLLDKSSYLTHWLSENQKLGTITQYEFIGNAYHADPKQIVTALLKCDTLAFTTTFYYRDSILGIAKLLEKIPHSINIIIDNPEANDEVRSLLTEEMAWNLKQHKFFQLIPYENEFISIDISDKIATHQKVVDEAAKIKKAQDEYSTAGKDRTTGLKVLIKKIVAVGKQWSNLHEGDIVDEIDNSLMDPNPNRGIWIWGLSEPVKLLNEGNYEEYELLTKDLNLVVLELCKTTSITITEKSQIYGIKGILLEEDLSTHEKANLICEFLKIPKRNNRQRIFEFIRKKVA